MPQRLKERLSKINRNKWIGKKNPRWSGGKRTNTQGYVVIRMPEHPLSDASGYVREHRLVMEKSIGRLLTPQEQVHHLNGIKTDNRIENLVLCKSDKEHKNLFHSHFVNHLANTPTHIKHLAVRKAG
jgi:hypothetical protein